MFSRILMLGVSPITLNELTSGYNIATNISNDERFNAMLGFSEDDYLLSAARTYTFVSYYFTYAVF